MDMDDIKVYIGGKEVEKGVTQYSAKPFVAPYELGKIEIETPWATRLKEALAPKPKERVEMNIVYHIDSMTINEQPVHVQDGIARAYTRQVIFWMGTPPSDEELQPKPRLDLHWERALIPIVCNINDEFDFVVKTSEGATITGRALILLTVHTRVRNGYRIMDEEPVVVTFQIEGADEI